MAVSATGTVLVVVLVEDSLPMSLHVSPGGPVTVLVCVCARSAFLAHNRLWHGYLSPFRVVVSFSYYIISAHALTFGVLSATSKLLHGESKGWSEVGVSCDRCRDDK